MDQFYRVTGALLVCLFSYAQYQGWSVLGSDEDKSVPRHLASGVYHK